MRIFLQPLYAESAYEPFRTIARALDGDSVEVSATVIESSIDGLPAGSSLVTVDGDVAYSSIGDTFSVAVQDLVRQASSEPRSRTLAYRTAGGEAKLLLGMLTPPPNVLILGAGLDAEPVVRFALELGWRVTVQDHRPAYIDSGDFAAADTVLCVPVDALSATIDLSRIDAVIVMSHHLASDRKYLEQLADTDIEYIGLLGPVDRRRRLLDELGGKGEQLNGRVRGPAGLDLGGRGPAAIALSIVAEMHRQIAATLRD